jgi:hypothetical protein
VTVAEVEMTRVVGVDGRVHNAKPCQAAASSTGTHWGTAPAVSQRGSLNRTCSAVPGSSKTWRALLAVDRAAWLRCSGGRVGAIDEAFEQGAQGAVVAGERGA